MTRGERKERERREEKREENTLEASLTSNTNQWTASAMSFITVASAGLSSPFQVWSTIFVKEGMQYAQVDEQEANMKAGKS